LDTEKIPLQPLVAIYRAVTGGQPDWTNGDHGSLRGPLKNKSLVEAHVSIPTLQVNYKSMAQIGRPIRSRSITRMAC